MWHGLEIFLTTASILVNGGFAVFILLQKNKKAYHWLFCLFSINMAVVGLSLLMFRTTTSLDAAWFWTSIYHHVGGAEAYILLLFLLFFPVESPLIQHKPSRLLLIPPFAFLVHLSPLFGRPGFIRSISLAESGNSIVVGPWFYVFCGALVVLIASVFLLLIRSSFHQDENAKRQYRLFLYSASLFLTIGFVFSIVLPPLGTYSFITFAPISASFLSLFLFYAILRHQLFDIQIVLRRSLVYSALIACLFAVFLGITELVRALQPDGAESSLGLFFVMALFLIALLFPLLRWLEALSQKLIFAQHHESRRRLMGVAQDLLDITDLELLLTRFGEEVDTVFAPSYIDIWGQRQDQAQPHLLQRSGRSELTLQQLQAKVAARCNAHQTGTLILPEGSPDTPQELQFVGTKNNQLNIVILLGARTGGKLYTLQDIALLGDLCRACATALKHALIHEQQRQQLLLKQHQIKRADAELARQIEAEPTTPEGEPAESTTPAADLNLSNRDISLALRKYDRPTEEVLTMFRDLHSVQRVMREQGASLPAALRTLLTEVVEYFKPENGVGERTRNRLKYEILRMTAFDGATEEQIMWDLGFEPERDFWAQRNPDQARTARYAYRGKGDYGATSRASFKRLKNEALDDILWRLRILEGMNPK